tara:strand:+ start:264 stop:533 length:270 start_codon:yes stop_codon:yes gene_type:complete
MAFKLTNPPFPKIVGKRKKAKKSAKQSVERAARIGVGLDEKKLRKRELHNLKSTKALVQEIDAKNKGKTKKAKRKRKKYDKQIQKMFNA